MKHIVPIITGPTASGKSSFALKLAHALGGEIINADSIQIYQDLKILSARPDPNKMEGITHHLYGTFSAEEECSVAKWCEQSIQCMQKLYTNNIQPILCGGTGLYLKGLIEGVAYVPEIPESVRVQSNALIENHGYEGLLADLEEKDPKIFQHHKVTDRQRMVRAWEVITATGQSILDWHLKGKKKFSNDYEYFVILILPPRDILKQQAEDRFNAMLDHGAIEEVKNLAAHNLDHRKSIAKAVGVKQIKAYLDGRLSLEEAREQSIIATRQYIKRQTTWFRHQLNPNVIIENPQDPLEFERVNRLFKKLHPSST